MGFSSVMEPLELGLTSMMDMLVFYLEMLEMMTMKQVLRITEALDQNQKQHLIMHLFLSMRGSMRAMTIPMLVKVTKVPQFHLGAIQQIQWELG